MNFFPSSWILIRLHFKAVAAYIVSCTNIPSQQEMHLINQAAHSCIFFYVQLFPFSEPSPWPPIKDAGNRCIKADLSGWGSPAPLYQRVVRPNWGGGSKYLSFVYFHCIPVWVIITWKWLSLLIASMFIDYGNHTWALPISDLLKNP